MRKRTFEIVSTGAAAFGLALSLLTPGSAAALPAAATTSDCMVVLECPGVTQQVAPDATGNFSFKDVPAGSCRVSVVQAAPIGHVTSPRDAASGLATGKRMHKPMNFQMVLDRQSAKAATATADDASSTSVTVVVQQAQKEFRGHVTLMK